MLDADAPGEKNRKGLWKKSIEKEEKEMAFS